MAKYRYQPQFLVNQEVVLSDYSNSVDELYCICREPYDINDKRPTKKMFQCEGPCQKWVHPSCFGETEETILHFEKNGIPYYCSFCRRDVQPDMLKMLKQRHAERLNRHQQQIMHSKHQTQSPEHQKLDGKSVANSINVKQEENKKADEG